MIEPIRSRQGTRSPDRALRPLLALVFFLLLSSPASAATPFVLPAGEQSAIWRPALELAAMAPGIAPESGAWVELRSEGGRWLLRVHDASGETRDTPVDPPVTQADREGVVLLAFSLLQPGIAPIEEAQPPRHPRDDSAEQQRRERQRIQAEQRQREEERLAAIARAEEAELAARAAAEQPAEPPPQVDVSPVRRRRGPGPWILARAALDLRPGLSAGLSGSAGGGAHLGRGFRLGALLEGKSPTEISALGPGEGRSTWEIGGLAVLKWSPDLAVAPALGVEIGLIARAFDEQRAPVARIAVPLLVLDLGASIRLGDALLLEPQARLRLDLRRTLLSERPGVEPRLFHPLSVQIGLSFSALPPSGERSPRGK